MLQGKAEFQGRFSRKYCKGILQGKAKQDCRDILQGRIARQRIPRQGFKVGFQGRILKHLRWVEGGKEAVVAVPVPLFLFVNEGVPPGCPQSLGTANHLLKEGWRRKEGTKEGRMVKEGRNEGW